MTQERTQIDDEEEIEIKGANGLRIIFAPDTDLKGGRIELHGEREVKKKKVRGRYSKNTFQCLRC